MNPVLGISVGAGELCAVIAGRGRVQWAATATYRGTDDLVAAIGRLAGDMPAQPRRVWVVVGRDLIQLRSLAPAPRLSRGAARRYVALESGRLFRKNGAPLVTDGRVVRVGPRELVLWAAAAAEPLIMAVVRACEEAGLGVEGLGPAAEVLPWALAKLPRGGDVTFPRGAMYERVSVANAGVWRSRLTRNGDVSPEWAPPLEAMGDGARFAAAAYAVTQRRPVLDLLPGETRAARRRAQWKRIRWAAGVGAALWLGAAIIHTSRVAAVGRAAERALSAIAPAVDSTMAMRRDLQRARSAVAIMRRAERERSETLMLLGRLTGVLGDSVFLSALQLSPDASLRLVGYAPQATRVLAQLEKVKDLREARFEAPVIRERVGPGDTDLDRFTVIARLGRPQ